MSTSKTKMDARKYIHIEIQKKYIMSNSWLHKLQHWRIENQCSRKNIMSNSWRELKTTENQVTMTQANTKTSIFMYQRKNQIQQNNIHQKNNNNSNQYYAQH